MITTNNAYVAQLFARLAEIGIRVTASDKPVELLEKHARAYQFVNEKDRFVPAIIIDLGDDGYRMFIEPVTFLVPDDVEVISAILGR